MSTLGRVSIVNDVNAQIQIQGRDGRSSVLNIKTNIRPSILNPSQFMENDIVEANKKIVQLSL